MDLLHWLRERINEVGENDEVGKGIVGRKSLS